MTLFLEPIQSFTCSAGVESLYRRLPDSLQAIGFEVPQKRDGRREIEIRCIVDLVNFLLWGCWADKAIVRLTAAEGSTTRVEIYCIPNLLRLKVKVEERVFAREELGASVRRAIARRPSPEGAPGDPPRDTGG
jgi:hypothetical protein